VLTGTAQTTGPENGVYLIGLRVGGRENIGLQFDGPTNEISQDVCCVQVDRRVCSIGMLVSGHSPADKAPHTEAPSSTADNTPSDKSPAARASTTYSV